MLCLFSGCQFYRNVVVDENGKVLPWREYRDDPVAQARWNERHAQWQIRTLTDVMMRAGSVPLQPNTPRAGLQPIR